MKKTPRIIVTAGSTRVPLDEIRFITTASRGRTGIQICRQALKMGWKVTYIHGQDTLLPVKTGKYLKLVQITTVDDLVKAMRKELSLRRYDAVIHAMAVSDFQQAKIRSGKVPSTEKKWTVKLKPAPKVIKLIIQLSPETILVSFKLETGLSRRELIARAKKSLEKYHADLVVANDWQTVRQNRHRAVLINKEGRVVAEKQGKGSIAREILRQVGKMLRRKK